MIKLVVAILLSYTASSCLATSFSGSRIQMVGEVLDSVSVVWENVDWM